MQNSQEKNITIALELYIVIWPKDIQRPVMWIMQIYIKELGSNMLIH